MWITVCQTADCPPGEGRELVAGEQLLALFNINGTFYAMDGICPHSGGPLGKGQLTGCMVTCPWHGWQFDVTTGRHKLNANYTHTTFPVRVEGDAVQVELPA
jgi:nitrite reductase (NADH) small subunit